MCLVCKPWPWTRLYSRPYYDQIRFISYVKSQYGGNTLPCGKLLQWYGTHLSAWILWAGRNNTNGKYHGWIVFSQNTYTLTRDRCRQSICLTLVVWSPTLIYRRTADTPPLMPTYKTVDSARIFHFIAFILRSYYKISSSLKLVLFLFSALIWRWEVKQSISFHPWRVDNQSYSYVQTDI